jgi:hypothetical protein
MLGVFLLLVAIVIESCWHLKRREAKRTRILMDMSERFRTGHLSEATTLLRDLCDEEVKAILHEARLPFILLELALGCHVITCAFLFYAYLFQ